MVAGWLVGWDVATVEGSVAPFVDVVSVEIGITLERGWGLEGAAMVVRMSALLVAERVLNGAI